MNSLSFLTPDHAALGNIESTATEILRRFIVDDSGMFRPPIDPCKLADDLGVEIRYLDLPEGLSGFIAKESAELPPVIYVNDDDSHVRQRFTIAHELGHLVQETALGNHVFQTLKREEGHANLGVHNKERWANGFAAGILMPAGATRSLYVSGESAREIAERLNVSSLAVEYRLANLGIS